jgi:hypothetical protein
VSVDRLRPFDIGWNGVNGQRAAKLIHESDLII